MLKASETRADVHGNTKIRAGDWVAVGSTPDDPFKIWGRLVEVNDERLYAHKSASTVEKWFVDDVVDYLPRDQEPKR